MTDTSHIPVIALDGPSGSGKTTIATLLASAIQFNILASGSLYRIAGFALNQRGICADDTQAVQDLVDKLDVQFVPTSDGLRIMHDGKDVSTTITQSSYSSAASDIATIPALRKALMSLQHSYRKPPGLIAEGRDMASVVFPEADIKVFLTASASVRANRRCQQLNNLGIDANLARLTEEIEARDEQDSQRALAPLKETPDAVRIDTSYMTAQETIDFLVKLVKQRGII